MGTTDYLLVRRMRQGDDGAIEEFVKKYYTDILRYCRYHCYETQFAEDLTQETFVHFFGHFKDYRHMGKLKNFLYTIAGNLCKDYCRKRKDITVYELPESEDNQMECLQDSLYIEWALRQLPDELREVVILHYFQGLKLREIADILEIGLSLVKYRIKRAKELLKEILGEEESS